MSSVSLYGDGFTCFFFFWGGGGRWGGEVGFKWMETQCNKIYEEMVMISRLSMEAPEDVLIGTDVASKGLDFPAIQHVPGMCDVAVYFIA